MKRMVELTFPSFVNDREDFFVFNFILIKWPFFIVSLHLSIGSCMYPIASFLSLSTSQRTFNKRTHHLKNIHKVIPK